MSETTDDTTPGKPKGRVVYRQKLATRLTHWVWAICMFFLLLSGLQIFNARPQLFIGQESGFEYNNAILEIGSEAVDGQRQGYTTIFGQKFNTSGVLGLSETPNGPRLRAFPEWATIPSTQDLATGRVVHFFFAWIFVGTLLIWLLFSIFNRHLTNDLIPHKRDFKNLPRDIMDHLRFKFTHAMTYSPLQKMTYIIVLFILFPLIILTGLAMSPGMNAAFPWIIDIFAGRQTARTIHFLTMAAFVIFFFVHIFMVVAAGPINEMRSMITGRYRLSPIRDDSEEPSK